MHIGKLTIQPIVCTFINDNPKPTNNPAKVNTHLFVYILALAKTILARNNESKNHKGKFPWIEPFLNKL